MYNWDNFKIVRYIKRGYWIKTKHSGWITYNKYMLYITCGYNPVFLGEEIYN